MKTNFAVLFLVLSVMGLSCAKKSDPLDLPSIQPNNKLDTLVFMSAKINGASWKTDSVTAYSVAYAYDSLKTNLLVNAKQSVNSTNDSGTVISFTITDFNGPNTYTINPPAVSAAYYIGTQRHYATAGQIVVSADSNYALLGTFNFVADSITVSSGSFNVETP